MKHKIYACAVCENPCFCTVVSNLAPVNCLYDIGAPCQWELINEVDIKPSQPGEEPFVLGEML